MTIFLKPVSAFFLLSFGIHFHRYIHPCLSVGKLTFADLDERAFEALKEFPTDGALAVLVQFVDSNLDHVSNKSAYLCGMMKTYRQKQKTSTTPATPSVPKGPDEEKIKVNFTQCHETIHNSSLICGFLRLFWIEQDTH